MANVQERSRTRRQRVLDAALEIFTEHGYGDTAIDEIARASDTSKGGLYFHFPSKQALFLALLDDIAAGAFLVRDLGSDDYRRVREICQQYRDADIGFVDASVLAMTERLHEPKLATLDRRHFGMLRPRHVEALTLLPE